MEEASGQTEAQLEEVVATCKGNVPAAVRAGAYERGEAARTLGAQLYSGCMAVLQAMLASGGRHAEHSVAGMCANLGAGGEEGRPCMVPAA